MGNQQILREVEAPGPFQKEAPHPQRACTWLAAGLGECSCGLLCLCFSVLPLPSPMLGGGEDLLFYDVLLESGATPGVVERQPGPGSSEQLAIEVGSILKQGFAGQMAFCAGRVKERERSESLKHFCPMRHFKIFSENFQTY